MIFKYLFAISRALSEADWQVLPLSLVCVSRSNARVGCEGHIAAGTAHPSLFAPPVPAGGAGAWEAAGAICGMARGRG